MGKTKQFLLLKTLESSEQSPKELQAISSIEAHDYHEALQHFSNAENGMYIVSIRGFKRIDGSYLSDFVDPIFKVQTTIDGKDLCHFLRKPLLPHA